MKPHAKVERWSDRYAGKAAGGVLQVSSNSFTLHPGVGPAIMWPGNHVEARDIATTKWCACAVQEALTLDPAYFSRELYSAKYKRCGGLTPVVVSVLSAESCYGAVPCCSSDS